MEGGNRGSLNHPNSGRAELIELDKERTEVLSLSEQLD